MSKGGAAMIKVLTERKIPPGFDTTDNAQAARHARIAVDALAAIGGPAHWVCTYVAGDSLFGVIVLEDEAALTRYQAAAGIASQPTIVRRITRVLEPAMAAPKAQP